MSRTDTAFHLLPLLQWSIDLLTYILDELMNVCRNVSGHEEDLEFFRSQVLRRNSPAIPLILSSLSRGYLTYLANLLIRILQKAEEVAKSPAYAAEVVLQRAWASVADLILASPLATVSGQADKSATAVLNQLLREIDMKCKAAYLEPANSKDIPHWSFSSSDARTAAELSLLVEGKIPETLLPTLTSLFTEYLPRYQSQVNVSRFYFTDTSWLGFSENPVARRRHKERIVDVVTKMEMRKGEEYRRCTRCASRTGMEGMWSEPGKRPPYWVYKMGLVCPCGGQWIVVGLGEQ